MALKLMYITNDVEVAQIADETGIDRIFLDMEYIGKAERQRGMDTVQSNHTYSDIKRVRDKIFKAELLVRCNPIHDKTDRYCSSEEEIENIIDSGADIIMLPMWKTISDVERFINIINGRTKTVLLLETLEASENIKKIVNIKGIDEIHIGLNDLHLAYNMKFMFELLANGTVEQLCGVIKEANIPYGFGGIACLGKGMLPAEMIIAEHVRLQSSMAILSRSFYDHEKYGWKYQNVLLYFKKNINLIREYENMLLDKNEDYFEDNRRKVCEIVDKIINQ